MEDIIPKKNKATFIAQRCVVCNGFGTLKYGSIICQACHGKGYITINQETGIPAEEGLIEGGCNDTE